MLERKWNHKKVVTYGQLKDIKLFWPGLDNTRLTTFPGNKMEKREVSGETKGVTSPCSG